MISVSQILEIKGPSHYNRSKIKKGMKVFVVKKQDQKSGILTPGEVHRILTNKRHHTRGIKVMLKDGTVGRIQRIVNEVVTNQPSTPYVVPTPTQPSMMTRPVTPTINPNTIQANQAAIKNKVQRLGAAVGSMSKSGSQGINNLVKTASPYVNKFENLPKQNVPNVP
jgi:uncharacterized repeat protein (TIGR03833 family)